MASAWTQGQVFMKPWASRALATVSALALAACSGGGGGTERPEISLRGVAYTSVNSDLTAGTLQDVSGGSGRPIANFIYVETGALSALATTSLQLDPFTTRFTGPGGEQIFVTTPTGFEDAALTRIEYTENGQSIVATGVLARTTSTSNIALVSGTAVYRGTDTVEVLALRPGQATTALLSGNAEVTADFDAARVDVVMNVFQGSTAVVTISGATIAGSGFSGGTLEVVQGGSVVTDLSGQPDHRGTFAGFNDATGSNLPAEVAGAFRATTAGGTVVGRYIAD